MDPSHPRHPRHPRYLADSYDKVSNTGLKKRSFKKLTLDKSTKAAFSFYHVVYGQIDGVSVGSYLGQVLANIIISEHNIKSSSLYCRYADDTLLVIKPDDVSRVHNLLNRFDNKLCFTVDLFENKAPHFLDFEISPDDISTFNNLVP